VVVPAMDHFMRQCGLRRDHHQQESRRHGLHTRGLSFLTVYADFRHLSWSTGNVKQK
jgi:hypothetical protein